MTKLLSVERTAYPDGTTVRHLFGMPQPEPNPLTAKQVRRAVNTVRKGGLNYRDLPIVEQAQKLADARSVKLRRAAV